MFLFTLFAYVTVGAMMIVPLVLAFTFHDHRREENAPEAVIPMEKRVAAVEENAAA